MLSTISVSAVAEDIVVTSRSRFKISTFIFVSARMLRQRLAVKLKEIIKTAVSGTQFV